MQRSSSLSSGPSIKVSALLNHTPSPPTLPRSTPPSPDFTLLDHVPQHHDHDHALSAAIPQSMAAVAPPLQSTSMDDSQQTNSGDRPADLPRPYKCPLCPKAFHRLEHQTRHIRTHTGEKPHGCQFPGCTKRFSRSDELTRHSRIHNNPNSRRNNKAHAFAQPGPPMPGYAYHDQGSLMPPPGHMVRSAPHSQVSSPNVSPPHSYAYTQAAYGQQQQNSNSPAASQMPANAMDINLLATAASQVERESAQQLHNPGVSRHPMQTHSHLQYPYPNRHSSTSLSAYALSNNSTAANSPLHSRCHSPSRHFETPLSTAPSSPTFSHDSISPTPDHTPLATPAHSPRLRPWGNGAHLQASGSSSTSLSGLANQHHHGSGIHLPSLQQLSLPAGAIPAPGSNNHSPPSSVPIPGSQMPAPFLAPMEPSVSTSGAFHLSPAGSANTTPYGSYGASHSHLADIMSRSRGEERKLPFPRVASSGEMAPPPARHEDAMEM